MAASVLSGIVKDGVIVPDSTEGLPEGARVRILVQGEEPYAGFWEEMAAWDAASEEAWRWIDKIEQEDAEEKA